MRLSLTTRLLFATLACGFLPCGAFGAAREPGFQPVPASPRATATPAIESTPSCVILRNTPLPGGAPVLPLSARGIKKIIVTGPGIVEAQGGSAHSPLLEAIRERGKRDGFQVVHEPWSAACFAPVSGGALTPDEKNPSAAGLKGEYFDNSTLEGKPAVVRIDEPRFESNGKAPGSQFKPGKFSVRWTGFIKPPVAGKYRIRLCGEGKARAWIKDQLVYDGWDKDPKKGGMGEFTNVPEFHQTELCPVRIEYRNEGPIRIGLHWMSFEKKDFSELKNFDAVILIMGGGPEPAREQEEFLAAAATVNPVTVAVFPSAPAPLPGRDGPPGRPTLLQSVSTPGLPWAMEHVPAVLQERAENDANALCDKLFSGGLKKKLP